MSNTFTVQLIDELDPESTAMLTGLNSRTFKPIDKQIDRVKQDGPDKFMEDIYVGFNHKSIGDSAFTTIQIRGVSFLAAKAIQDNQLYNGVETSTRYINFTDHPFVNYIQDPEAAAIQQRWISTYADLVDPMIDHFRETYPQGDKSIVEWNRGIHAQVFDVIRSFLPAGMVTQLSWTTNVRQAYDKLVKIKHHELKEVRLLAIEIMALLKKQYPASFSHSDRPARDAYLEKYSHDINYYEPNSVFDKGTTISNNIPVNTVLGAHLGLLRDRPRYVELPTCLNKYGTFTTNFDLDFGSFRDIQRHRNGSCPIPVLGTDRGFNQWYLEQLPLPIRGSIIELIREQVARIKKLQINSRLSDIEVQYLVPIGFNIRGVTNYTLSQQVYVAELRSSSTVHPTLRELAIKMGDNLANLFPEMALYIDRSKISTSDVIKRGKDQILDKGKEM